MNLKPAIGCLAAITLFCMPVAAQEQTVNITGSPLPDQPYTLIYPTPMMATAEAGGPLTINHPDIPLQCILTVVPADDAGWTAEGALAALDDAAVTQGWSATLPGFALTNKAVTAYQSNPALMYEGTSTDSPQGVPLTVVHTETVAEGNGYTLDCIYATEAAANARPIVDYVLANFSTQQDAEPVAPAQ
ncbi:hypothetical protein [Devosia sp. FKR38]|uniref:hypothetical protein n=1 Tax=Devosia sp. FKR38 TaxID=2562312 RepID=UPI0010C00F2A|nr:hypothetical protein [Devosia sp. FKR38]